MFIYDVGELDGSSKYQNFLTNDSVYFRQLMRNYSGIGIVWEHRYCEFANWSVYIVSKKLNMHRWQLYACGN